METVYPKSREQWLNALESLPEVKPGEAKIPAIYFGHGHNAPRPKDTIFEHMGPRSPLAGFLRDFGPAILKKYKPKAIVVFSAHWESDDEIHGRELYISMVSLPNITLTVTNYGDENPLLMDYYGFPAELYADEKTKFKSQGDSVLSERVVNLLKEHNIPARTISQDEPRGVDGRGFKGPGLDHDEFEGVFVPFKLMFGDQLDVPVVQVSIDGGLDPIKNWSVGKALDKLRSEEVLIITGGLTIHTFQEFSAFSEKAARPIYKEFDKAVNDAAMVSQPTERREALLNLVRHPGFRLAHPREEHFIPIYIAAGCADEGESRVVSSIYGAITVVFGV
ncbi:hypothetical protein Clacol_006271 [Clathrus columnatus]|uniref:Extradiol ring-cleavage dioxygenase class III enzyme subunit B domain-containing protein n=1 Tax=Clathrus columnatus TaxID=1419009 RepID=A0AAV5ABL4_9AGAM|nr:hypothetical protein Clacol_006271 [Clathrus columnatus]